MSQTSEDTSVFLDISPYPNSINSNNPIDEFLFHQQQQQAQPETPFPTTPYSPYSQPSSSNELDRVERCNEKELNNNINNNNMDNDKGECEQRQSYSEHQHGMVKEKKERMIGKPEQIIHHHHHQQQQQQQPSSSPFTTTISATTPQVQPTKEEEEEEESDWRFHCPCGIDKENYDDGMPMVQCSDCKAWSHIACAKYEEKTGGEYQCIFCRRKKR